MKIAVVGGTGDCGRGFALRWAGEHEIIVGSRSVEKAEESAGELTAFLRNRGVNASITGMDNRCAVEASELVVVSVPYRFVESTIEDLADHCSNQIFVSPVVPMSRHKDKSFRYTPPSQGSASLMIRDILPSAVKVVSAFHTISYAVFQDLDRVLVGDVLICGDDENAKKIVADLVSGIRDLRPLDAGPIAVSAQIESLTPLLLNISRLNKVKNAGIKIVVC